MKQLQQTAAVPRNGDIFIKIIAPLFLQPTLAVQFTNQKAGSAGYVTQLLLVDVLSVKGRLRQLLLQSAPQHGV